MSKKLKISIKNKQIAVATGLKGLKKKVLEKQEKVIPTEQSPVLKARAKARTKTLIKSIPQAPAPLPSIAPPEEKAPLADIKPSAPPLSPPSPPPAKKPQEAPQEIPVIKSTFTAPPKNTKSQVSQFKKAPSPRRLGPTGRHVNDLIAQVKAPFSQKNQTREQAPSTNPASSDKGKKGKKIKDYKTLRPLKKQDRSRQQLLARAGDSDQFRRRKRKNSSSHAQEELQLDRPSKLHLRLPISVKELASQMKRKASELIAKLFMQGLECRLNDELEDETTVELLGQEFDCVITLDTSEESRLRITDQSIEEEIAQSDDKDLSLRPPIVAFMGHVDHGKTSIIDFIRKTTRVQGEKGAITQHIGAFFHTSDSGSLCILDTPGHEAFTAMRARGAQVTDLVVLVIAGDEGIRAQTTEAIKHAKLAAVTIVVAINKCDKPEFNAENVYRQLADADLLPEAWGGSILTINCSAKTGEGIPELLDMLTLQSEVLELKASASMRARGHVIESEMHKGMGAISTLLIQNGTLKKGDALVFDDSWGRVRTMQDDSSKFLTEASPSTPVRITGLSSLPAAGHEFIVVESEKEAKRIAEARRIKLHYKRQLPKITDPLLQDSEESDIKVLRLLLRADVQGSLEALKTAILNIQSDKAKVEIIFSSVGEVSESDVSLAAASKAVIIGFHTRIESHAASMIKELGVHIANHDIIYAAIDAVKEIMSDLLDTITQEKETGKAEIRAVFKVSRLGRIAGCIIAEGEIQRKHFVRLRRGDAIVWKGKIDSLRREKDDVREVREGYECGILLQGFHHIQVGDIIEAYELEELTQEL